MAIDAFRDRLMVMYRRVGLVFYMPQTRDRFRDRLCRKWQRLGQERQMLMESIQRHPQLKEEYRRRMAERVLSEMPVRAEEGPDRGGVLQPALTKRAPPSRGKPIVPVVPAPTRAELSAYLGPERRKQHEMERSR